MNAHALLDTNILVYAYSNDRRSAKAEALVRARHEISVQSLNEFVNVARRKMGLEETQIEDALFDLVHFAHTVHPLSLATHASAYQLSRRYPLHIYDALIVAVALEAGCDTLYSEDMQHGLRVEDRLTIVDPFA